MIDAAALTRSVREQVARRLGEALVRRAGDGVQVRVEGTVVLTDTQGAVLEYGTTGRQSRPFVFAAIHDIGGRPAS